MQARSTTAMGKEHEEYVEKVFKWADAKRSKSSGASYLHPIDVESKVSVIECEATEKKSYSLKLSFWDEVCKKQKLGKMPILAIRFRDAATSKHTDLGVISLTDLSDMLEELEYYRDEAIKSN